jgi:hypothetical protein
VLDRFRLFDELSGPTIRLVLFDPITKRRRQNGNGRCGIEIIMVCGPPERDAQVRQLDDQPRIRLPLAWTVPECHHIGFPSGEVSRVGGTRLVGFASAHQLFFGELADGLEHRKPCATGGLVYRHKRFAHKRFEQIQRGVSVTAAPHRLGTFYVESACEY